MSNIFGVPAFGGGGISHRPPPDHLGQQVPEVTAIADDTSATFNKGSNLPGQNGDSFNTSQSKQDDSGAYAPSAPRAMSAEKPHFDADTLTGPTPSFQASVLEVDSDLRNVIAQIEAKRAQQSDAAAIAPAPKMGAAAIETDPQDKAELSSTARRGQRDIAHEADATPVPLAAVKAPRAEVQTEVLDREAAYSGRAATAEVPYNKPAATEYS